MLPATCSASLCCTPDTAKCAGYTGFCDTGKYNDPAKDGDAAGTTDTEKKTNCCTTKAFCDSVNGNTAGAISCPPHHVKISAPDNMPCLGNAASCTASLCCTPDTSKCAGVTVACGTDKYEDTAKDGETAGTTDADKKAACCTAKAKCDTFTCPAGYNKKSDAATTHCPGNAATCTESLCCTPDTPKCVGTTVTCDTDMYKDVEKAGQTAGTTDADKKAACCTTRATCATFQPVSSRASKSETMVTLFLGMF